MTLTDIDQLRRLLQRYARAVDSRDMAALKELFHPEAVLHGLRGQQSLAEWLEAMSAPRTSASMHFLADPLIQSGGDSASMDTYAVVYQIASGRPEMTLGMRYLDETVRLDRGWVIRSRRAESLWKT